MAQIPANVREFMKANGVEQDEIWLLPGGRSYAIKHSALERIAHQRAITFDQPQIIESDGANGIATVLVAAHLGDASTWTFGEASPKNNKNAYCFAMAEKRAKDRCILKLLNTHGAIYSEDEADDFKQPAPVAKDAPRQSYAGIFIDALQLAQSVDELTEWAKNTKPSIVKLHEDDQAAIRDAYAAHRTKLAEAEYQKEQAA